MRRIAAAIFYLCIVRPWLKVIIGVRFTNRQVFKDLDQFIVVANHNSHFDMVSILAALPVKQMMKTQAIAAGDYFGKNKLFSGLMNFFFNAILIKRKREEGEPSALEIINDHLKQGSSLVMFPEGSRGKPGVMADFKHGVAVLLQEHPEIPFVPVYLDGFGRVLPKDETLILPMVCKVRFGEPIYPKSDTVEGIIEEVKAAILALNTEDERQRNQFYFKEEKA